MIKASRYPRLLTLLLAAGCSSSTGSNARSTDQDTMEAGVPDSGPVTAIDGMVTVESGGHKVTETADATGGPTLDAESDEGNTEDASTPDTGAPRTSPDSGTKGAKDSGSDRDGSGAHDAATKADGGSGPLTIPSQVPAGWKIALDDDFTGAALGANWNLGTDQGTFVFGGTTYWDCWIPAESEYPTAAMVKIDNSDLILSVTSSSAIAGDQGSKSFVSGYVNTYGQFAFQYGYIEIRAQLPAATAGSQTGLWPALWLFNSTYSNEDEIDLVESFGGDQTSIGMTVHNAAINKVNSTGDQVVVTITPGYHVFGALHEASAISFYVDNKLEKTFDDVLPSEMAINLGMQLGNANMGWISGPVPANWGAGVHGAHAPDLDIDWVHVWTP